MCLTKSQTSIPAVFDCCSCCSVFGAGHEGKERAALAEPMKPDLPSHVSVHTAWTSRKKQQNSEQNSRYFLPCPVHTFV